MKYEIIKIFQRYTYETHYNGLRQVVNIEPESHNSGVMTPFRVLRHGGKDALCGLTPLSIQEHFNIFNDSCYPMLAYPEMPPRDRHIF